MTLKKLFIAASFYLFMSSCADLKVPRPIIYCTLQDTAFVQWKQGKGIIKKDIDTSVYTYFNYERSDEKYHYFKFGILNQTDTPLLIDPNSIFFTYLSDSFATTYKIIDPEDMILKLRYNSELARTEAENNVIRAKNANTGMLFTAVGVGLTAATISSMDKKSNHNTQKSTSSIYRHNNSYCNRNYSIPLYNIPAIELSKNIAISQINQNESNQMDESNVLLRKTTLYNNQSCEGIFLIPILKDFEHSIYINIPVKSQLMEYQYSQKIYQPTQIK